MFPKTLPSKHQVLLHITCNEAIALIEPDQVRDLMSASHQKKLQAHLIIETINPVFI